MGIRSLVPSGQADRNSNRSPMTGNFLPDIQPVVTHLTEDTCQCLVRDKSVRATPEERVRQRVLHWLIHDKG